MDYLHIEPEATLPKWPLYSHYQAILVLEEKVSPEWQKRLSNWLVQSGCLYMMAWGQECSSWNDSVDIANSEAFNYEEIPKSKFVMTTWHEKETLKDVFWFSKYGVVHPSMGRLQPIIIHISKQNKRDSLLADYENA